MKTAAICIATYRREEGLIRLLSALREQTPPQGWTAEIRVVNNDPRADLAAFANAIGTVISSARIAHEPRRNIAHARNTAVEMGHADAFVFIDDDEVPTQGWLAALLTRLTDADAVIGPVAGRVPASTPRWLVRSGAFDKPGPNHDGPIDWRTTRTSSTAVSGEWIGRPDRLFNPEYGTSGGSDAEFFRRIESQGARFVHERAALVYEDIEPDRCTPRAVLTRRFRAGAVFGRMQPARSQSDRYIRLLTRLALAVFMLVAATPHAIIGRPEHAFNQLCRVAIALGAWRGHNRNYRVTRYPAKPVHATHSANPALKGGPSCASLC